MLEEKRFESFFDERSFPLDAEEGEDVAVFGNDLVLFDRVVVEFAVVSEV